jgi:hypothetical protein
VAVLEAEAEPVGGGPGAVDEIGVLDLRQVDEPCVVAEVVVAELGVAVESEVPDHESIEVPDQVVGEVEGPDLGVLEFGEGRVAGEELVAVGARQAFDSEFLADGVQPATGATVGVADEDLVVATLGRTNPFGDGIGDEVGGVVVGGWQALDVDSVQAVGPYDLEELPGEGSAGDDEDPPFGRRLGVDTAGHEGYAAARSSAMRRPAVSAATAASRQ